MADFVCNACGATKQISHETIACGYAYDDQNNKVCYDCCAERDKKHMRDTGKNTLYLTHNPITDNSYPFADGYISNWPGSLKLPCRVKSGRHNIARYRYDAWFTFEGKSWHGVSYGDNTQIVHCKQIKR